jgi:hypothetical protein
MLRKAWKLHTDPFIFHHNIQSSQGQNLKIKIQNKLRFVKRSQCLFNFINEAWVLDLIFQDRIQVVNSQINLKIESNVDHDVDFGFKDFFH